MNLVWNTVTENGGSDDDDDDDDDEAEADSLQMFSVNECWMEIRMTLRVV